MTDTKLTESGIISALKEKYTPHFNLYQKDFFEKKVNCYQKNSNDLPNYYQCLRKVDEQMLKNSDHLRQTFGNIDIELKNNETTCLRFKESPKEYDQCIQKTLKQFRFASVNTYDEFYKKNLSHRSEWRKVR